jgi:hypothetical protein
LRGKRPQVFLPQILMTPKRLKPFYSHKLSMLGLISLNFLTVYLETYLSQASFSFSFFLVLDAGSSSCLFKANSSLVANLLSLI